MAGVELPTDLLWDMISKTALVLALLYGVLWAIRRLNRGVEGVRRGPSIQVIHSAHLGPGRSVHLLGVGGQFILVGATSQQVSMLTEVEYSVAQLEPTTGESAATFERCLRQTIGAVEGLPSRLMGKREGRDGADRTGQGGRA